MQNFSVLCYARNNPRQKDKLASRSRRCVFLGYLFGKKGWQVQDLDTHEVFFARDAIFSEDIFPFAPQRRTLMKNEL